jgi:hypothetical protein
MLPYYLKEKILLAWIGVSAGLFNAMCLRWVGTGLYNGPRIKAHYWIRSHSAQ